ncbi:CGP-CTERM sorting domain-containing protein [Thermococcus sp.]|uniref:Gldg family protein n=1 Tax=Thermococcus sp. TaxID=35749 RepID=UPI00260C0AFB|nr:CGP-CTERM sorting domain-containing protein [Thermococcus sp.]
MRRAAILIAAFVLFSVFGFAMASAAETTPIATVAVDLAHGENPKGLTPLTYKNQTLTPGILETIKDMKWVYFGDPKYADELGIKDLGSKITYDALKGVDVLIIPQPTNPFYPDEVQAIKQWLQEGGKVLWVAGDSDYGSGVKTQQFVDSLLDQLGITNLRVDLCSVEDPVSNAGKSYRVIALVQPSPDTPAKDMITKGFKYGGKVLEHGPGVVAWVDNPNGQGNWHVLNDTSRPKYTYVIVRTTKNGEIVENNAPAAHAYQAGNTGQFPIVAVQIVELQGKKPDVIIVSGETPIGGYMPMWASVYYGVKLDGPTFINNFLHWSVDVAQGKIAPTSTTSSSSKKICGPAAIVGLAVIPLLLRRRK